MVGIFPAQQKWLREESKQVEADDLPSTRPAGPSSGDLRRWEDRACEQAEKLKAVSAENARLRALLANGGLEIRDLAPEERYWAVVKYNHVGGGQTVIFRDRKSAEDHLRKKTFGSVYGNDRFVILEAVAGAVQEA